MKGDILIPKEVAQGLGKLDQYSLGYFFKRLLHSAGYAESSPDSRDSGLAGAYAFTVLEPLLKSVNGFGEEGPEGNTPEKRRQE